MKTPILIIALFLPLVVFASTNAVTFNLADFTTGVITNRQVKMEPRSTPRSGPTNNILSRDSLFRYTDTNGTFIVTNMQWGTYYCTLLGPYAKTDFRIYVPDSNAVFNASDLLVSSADSGVDTEDGISLDLE